MAQSIKEYVENDSLPDFMIDFYEESPYWKEDSFDKEWFSLSDDEKRERLDSELDAYFVNTDSNEVSYLSNIMSYIPLFWFS